MGDVDDEEVVIVELKLGYGDHVDVNGLQFEMRDHLEPEDHVDIQLKLRGGDPVEVQLGDVADEKVVIIQLKLGDGEHVDVSDVADEEMVEDVLVVVECKLVVL